jgi:hypothetical protein
MTRIAETTAVSFDPKSYALKYGNIYIPQAMSPVEGLESFTVFLDEVSGYTTVSDHISSQNEQNEFNSINLLKLSASRKPLVPEVNSTLPFVEQFELSNWQSMLASEWQDLLRKLTTFASLPDGWNGYTAPPPSALAVRHSRIFLFSLSSLKFPPYRLKPSVVGGIAFSFRQGQRKAYIEFFNEGNAYALFSDSESEPITKPILTSTEGYLVLIKEIREYFNG